MEVRAEVLVNVRVDVLVHVLVKVHVQVLVAVLVGALRRVPNKSTSIGPSEVLVEDSQRYSCKLVEVVLVYRY